MSRPLVYRSMRAALNGGADESALRDLAFLVREVLPARGTELLHLELLRHRALVLRRHVVGALAVPTGHLDDITHDFAREMEMGDVEADP